MIIKSQNNIMIKVARMIKFWVIVCAIFISAFVSSALPTSHYSANSVLANGKWVKIKITQPGMQFISNAKLKEWGFSDPSKVNVYGYGGQRIALELSATLQPDDLPMQPVVRTDNGLCFYGVGTIKWTPSGSNTLDYIHSQNIYSTDSYYFLSDVDIEEKTIDRVATPIANDAQDLTVFTERILHEKELVAPANTGAMLLGEDFRASTSQTFSFALPNQADDVVNLLVSFGAKTTNGSSSLIFKANGQTLPATSSDKISAVTDVSSYHVKTVNSYKTVEGINDKLSLQINYTPGGVLYLARLDFIVVNYSRKLQLADGKLHFYQNVLSADKIVFNVDGCDSNTIIWDVTSPHSPKQVDFELVGTIARFAPDSHGAKEYMAFNPGQIRQSPEKVANVSNQNIHAMPTPHMLIISPSEYISQARRIAELHEEVDGMVVHVLTPQEIYNEFSSGAQDVSAFRKLLKMWHDRASDTTANIGYCLLFGRPSYDNRMITEKVRSAGYPRLPIWQSESSASESASFSNDDLIGMLDDCESNFNMSSAKLTIPVGRMPVKSLAEATQMADKLIKYVKEPNLGGWRNNVMIIADDEDNGIHLEQAEKAYKAMRRAGNGENFIYERLYLDSYPLGTSSSGKAYPQAKERMFQMFDEGVVYIDYIGHANPSSWTHEGLLNYTDILNFSNTNLPFMYTATCEFTRWDDDDISGAEIMWLHPNTGAIGMISATRKVYISQNGTLNEATSRGVFERDADGKPRRVGDIYINGKNNYPSSDSNKLRYMLMADPAMRIQSPTYQVVIDSIGDKNAENLTDASDYPVIPARGRVTVKGHIADATGQIIEDFNGTIIPTLFDAERVIETYGNGEDGKVEIYNDRKNKLFVGKMPVINGQWEITILMPSEIDNNYSPALLNLYAYSRTGLEANGATEQLYIYGWDEDAPQDLDGPEINLLALNSEAFSDGMTVNDTPLLLASFRDDSGINISSSGIGHQMTAIVDGKKVFDDLVNFYEPDIEDFTAGSVIYALPELEQGEHSLTFTVWDNANNSSSQTITFNVSKTLEPEILNITTDVNPASTHVNFFVSHDRPSSNMTVIVDVFDIGGRKVWSGTSSGVSDFLAPVQISWNLRNFSGVRVPRGIYLYRATVVSPEGSESTMTKKLAVTAP